MNKPICIAPDTGNYGKILILFLLIISLITCFISIHALFSGYLISSNIFDLVVGVTMYIFTFFFFAGLAVFSSKSLIDKTPLVQIIVCENELIFQSRKLFQKKLKTRNTIKTSNSKSVLITTKIVHFKGGSFSYYFLSVDNIKDQETELLHFSNQDKERLKSAIQTKMPNIIIKEETQYPYHNYQK